MIITKEKILSSLDALEKDLVSFKNALSKEGDLPNQYLNLDPKLPNLYLWCKYQQYQNKIICELTIENDEDYNELAKLYDVLNLESFYVAAKDRVDDSIEKLSCYIKEVKTNIKGYF